MQIKPKILQGQKPKMTYITGVESTVNPELYDNFKDIRKMSDLIFVIQNDKTKAIFE